jgi:hypothetical protein
MQERIYNQPSGLSFVEEGRPSSRFLPYHGSFDLFQKIVFAAALMREAGPVGESGEGNRSII